MQQRPKCPTPNKKRYRRLEDAERALHDPRLGQTLYSPTRAYECECGGAHLTAKRRHRDPDEGRSRRNRRRR